MIYKIFIHVEEIDDDKGQSETVMEPVEIAVFEGPDAKEEAYAHSDSLQGMEVTYKDPTTKRDAILAAEEVATLEMDGVDWDIFERVLQENGFCITPSRVQ